MNDQNTQDTVNIEVAYATPEKQILLSLTVQPGTTMMDAAKASGIEEHFPGLNVAETPMGIFGKTERQPASRVLIEGDRIELYRPLIADPKEVRKQRAAKAKAKKEGG